MPTEAATPLPHQESPMGSIRHLSGRLVFADASGAATTVPLHHFPIRLWSHHSLRPDEVIGEITTDADGRFTLAFDFGKEKEGQTLDVRLKGYEGQRTYAPGVAEVISDSSVTGASSVTAVSTVSRPSALSVVSEVFGVFKDANGSRDEWVEVFKTDLTVAEHEGHFDLGTLAVHYWPYRAGPGLPRVAPPLADGEPFQKYSLGRAAALDARLLEFGGVIGAHLLANKLSSHHPELATIQKSYPTSLTLTTDAATPGRSRGDAWLGDRVLNGGNPCLLGRDRSDPALYRFKLAWGDVPPAGPFDLSDVDASFALTDGELKPVRIALRTRRAAAASSQWASIDAPRTFTQGGGADWEAAKRVFRVALFLQLETDAHLMKGHFRHEQYCAAAFRNLRLSPVRHLLAPHFSEIVPTNVDGDSLAWGPSPKGSIPGGSAMSHDAIQERSVRLSASEDWSTFRPREPLAPTHRYAHAANLFWSGVLTPYIDRWFQLHVDGIEGAWVEIHRLSDDLVAHSVPYAPLAADPDCAILAGRELDDPGVPRVTVGGVVRALRPITTRDQLTDPADLERLKQLCRYVIFHSTFWHSWVHDRQYDEAGEILYASLALRNGSLGPESDASIAPSPDVATMGLFTIAVGCNVKHGLLLSDEYRDLPPLLGQLLSEKRSEFERLGVDINQIRSRINI